MRNTAQPNYNWRSPLKWLYSKIEINKNIKFKNRNIDKL